MRIFKLLFAGLVFAAGMNSLPAKAITLKQNSIIEDNTIKLGDVFNGLKRNENKILGPAPLPGKDMTLNARTLMRIAVAMDLPWRPQHSSEQVILKRAATVIGSDVIKEEIHNALLEHGVQGEFDVSMRSGFGDIILPESEPAQVEVDRFSFSPETNSFEAVIVAPSKDNPIYTTSLTGTIARLVKIPVLRNPLRSGTIIGERDIHTISIKESALRSNIILDARDLIGLTPRTLISSGAPVKINDLEQPQVVSRGSLVTMVFKNGTLTLTTQGKAMENGAVGDLIRVVNAGSNRTVQGLVSGDNEVVLQSY